MSVATWHPTTATDRDIRPDMVLPETSSEGEQLLLTWYGGADLDRIGYVKIVGTSAGEEPLSLHVIPSTSSNVVRTLAAFAQYPAHIDRPKHRENVVHGETVLGVVTDLRSWLGITKTQVAELGGFDRRNLSNWERGGAYPSTVRHLLSVHALVGAIVDKLGQGHAMAWLMARAEGPDSGAASVVRLLSDSQRLSTVAKSASRFLYETPNRPSQYEDLAFEADSTEGEAPRVARTTKPVIQVARPPKRRA